MRLQRLPKPRPVVLLVIILFAVAGSIALMRSHAATPFLSAEAESGSITSPAASVADSTASGASAVQFLAATPPPTRTLNCTPAPSATMTNNVSHLCGFPDATTAGIPAGKVLKRVPQDITSGAGWHYDSRGWITVDTAGAVVDGIDTALNIDVTANNVTVKNSRVRLGGESFGISIRHTSGVTIQNNEVGGLNTSDQRLLVAIVDIYHDSSNLKIIGNNVYMASTGIQMEAGLIQDNYIHDLGLTGGDHVNGTTSNGGSTQLNIIRNTVFNQHSQTDAISLFEDFGGQSNRTIDNNLVAGGGYCIYGGQNAGGPATSNIKITNNHFSRMYYSGCGSFGPIAAWSSGGGNVWSGNIWDDTGATL